MTVKDIFEFLNEKFPISTAEDFDNVGLLIGDENALVNTCVIALDCTKAVIGQAKNKGAQLIITHHPVIFEPLKAITADSIPALCIKNGISVISMHTNMDTGQSGVNDALCATLKLKDVKAIHAQDGYLLKSGDLPEKMTAEALAKYVSEKLGAPVRYTCGDGEISTALVCSGSGGSFLEDALRLKAQAFITGDVKHNVFLEAADNGLTLIDAGHFYTEDVIVEPLCKMLSARFPEITFATHHAYPVKFSY